MDKEKLQTIGIDILGILMFIAFWGWIFFYAGRSKGKVEKKMLDIERHGDSLYYIKNGVVDTVVYEPEDIER